VVTTSKRLVNIPDIKNMAQRRSNPFVLDSPRPTITLKDYAYNELRYKNLEKANPKEAACLMEKAQELVDLRWQTYENMNGWKAEAFAPVM